MLEQTAELMAAAGEAALCERLQRELAAPPLPKPADHKGGPATDMFVLVLELPVVEAICNAVSRSVASGVRSSGTRRRGLGGFAEAWNEYKRYCS
jgi:hypothetical protein